MQPGSTEAICSKSRLACGVLEATTASDQSP
jgi:hypothetical protein